MSLLAPLLLSAVAAHGAPTTSMAGLVVSAAAESSNPADGPPPMTLSEALSVIADGAPRTLALRAQIEDARADVKGARVAPNPTLDYAATRLRTGTNTGAAEVDTYAVEWPILVFGQRRERIRAAEQGVEAEKARVESDLADRARDVRFAFSDLLAQQERTRILEEARADLERVAKIISGRQSAGEASEYESLRVQTEFVSMDAQLGDSRGDLADAQGHLAVLLGRPGAVFRAAGTLTIDTTAPVTFDALWPIASEHLPALVAARKEQDAAEEAVRSAHRDAYPVPVLSAGAALTRDAESTSATFGVSIPLPVLDRNQGARAHAQARADEAALTLKAVEAEARADLERAVEVAVKRRAALAQLDAGVSPKLPQMRSMAEAAYHEGRADILELLDAFRSMTSTQLARVDAFTSAAHAETDLLALTGRAATP